MQLALLKRFENFFYPKEESLDAVIAAIVISLEMLNRYPIIRNIFLEYNTALPSSAPVERLFSFAGIINQSRRQNLSDSNFEMLVLRKANSSK